MFIDDPVQFAQRCAEAVGMRERIEIMLDGDGSSLAISGPDHFGFLGSTTWRTLRVPLPARGRSIALVIARILFAEFWATDDEIIGRANELPLLVAMALESDHPE